jgi:hypothetical protein
MYGVNCTSGADAPAAAPAPAAAAQVAAPAAGKPAAGQPTVAAAATATTTGAGARPVHSAAMDPAAALAAASVSSARRLTQFGMGPTSCEVFLRAVRVPSAIELELVPPRGCVTVGGARCAGNWTVRAFPVGCGTTFASVSTPVAESVWIDDLRSGNPPAWCANWTSIIAPLPPPATLAVRSQYDPYAEAADITGCTFNVRARAMNVARAHVLRDSDLRHAFRCRSLALQRCSTRRLPPT